MNSNLLLSIVSIAFAAFFSSSVLAEAGRPEPAGNPEPYRIYDLGSRNVINNPDYRAPARVKPKAKRRVNRADDPQRIYNPMTQQFEDSRSIREPVSRRR
jgi:hypothetical protein